MRSNRWLILGVTTGAVLLAASSASAQEVDVRLKAPHEKVVVEGRGLEAKEGGAKGEGKEENERYPVSYPERPITMGALVLDPILSFSGGQVEKEGFAGMFIGARFGITNDMEVHAYPVPVIFAPSKFSGYGGAGPVLEGLGGPSLGARFRFLKGEFEMGVGADVTIFTGSITGVQIAPSIPMRLHVGKTAALDASIIVPINAALNVPIDGEKNYVGLEVPLAFSVDIIEPLHVGVNSGFGIGTFKEAGHSIEIPAGVFAGYAIAGKGGPVLDIDPFFRWPKLFTPGADGAGAAGDKVHAGDFQVGVEIGGFFYL